MELPCYSLLCMFLLTTDRTRSMIFVFSGIFTFLVDAYPVYAASALGANALTRSLFGAGFPLFGAASK